MVKFETLNEYEKLTFIFQYLSIVVACVGTVANVFTFIVLSRRRFENYSFAFYSKVRVFMDIGVLLHSFRHFAAFVLDSNIDLTSELVCKLAEYVAYIFGSMSVWLLTLMSFDRLVTIVYPNKFIIMKKKNTQLGLVVAMLLYSVCLYLTMPFYTSLSSRLAYDNRTNTSTYVLTCSIENESQSKLIYWIDLVNLMTVTFGINNVLAGIIIVFIFRSRKKFKTGKENREKRATLRDRKFAINSIALNFKCFLCKMPLLFTLLITSYVTVDHETVQMLFTVSVTIFTIDNSSALFVNLMVNSIFYDEFMTMIGFKKRTKSSHSIFSSNSTIIRTQV